MEKKQMYSLFFIGIILSLYNTVGAQEEKCMGAGGIKCHSGIRPKAY